MSSISLLIIGCSLDDSDENKEKIRIAASNLLEKIDNSEYCSCATVLHFLRDVKEGKCIYSSNKGGGLGYSSCANYAEIRHITEELKPFFAELWRERIMGAYESVLFVTSWEGDSITEMARMSVSENKYGRYTSMKAEDIDKDVVVQFYQQPWSLYFNIY